MSAQTIYNQLRSAGMTHAGACGMLGNMECESGIEPHRLQGDFTADRIKSWLYVNDIDLGNISRETMSTDSRGLGLCQWTFHSRKAALYDFAKACGVSIADEEMQVNFALKELQKDFPELWTLLCTTDSIQKASDGICQKFENPAIKNYSDRLKAAMKYNNITYTSQAPSNKLEHLMQVYVDGELVFEKTI